MNGFRAVLDICQYYNRSKQFNAYGFGAIVSQYSQSACHLFSLADPQVKFILMESQLEKDQLKVWKI